MLTKLALQGFKSFYDETIELNNLTVLTGLNSSGKSSVIQALRMTDRVCRKQDFLLPGHGDYKELKNKQWGELMKIEIEDSEQRLFVTGECGADVTDHFPQLIYISAARFGPQVIIPMNANDSEPDEFGQNVVKCISDHADEMMPSILKKKDMVGNTFGLLLPEWLKIISPQMKFDYKIETKADMSYVTFNEHRSKNVGFGLSFSLPVIAALMLGAIKKNSIVIIENPEAHLHAKAQTDMAELIARCVEAGAQVIVETHSDHLFDGLRIYTKEHPGFEKKMNCYWFELNEELNTEPTLIEINHRGRIINEIIPENFMSQFADNSNRLLFGK